MASVTHNKQTKKWEFVIGYYDKNGKRKQIRRRGFNTKREANDLMIELQKEVKDEDYVEINHVTVLQFIKQWFENEYIMEVEDTTYYNFKSLSEESY